MARFVTTDIKLLREKSSFTWGNLVKIHEIESDGTAYSIVEFIPDNLLGWPQSKGFMCFVNDKEVGSTVSFDSALLLCIANKHRTNSVESMVRAACKLLDVPV